MANSVNMQKLIDELKDSVHSSRFEQVFNEKTAHLSGPQKLQLKLRLNELTKPSTQTIDLRRKVPGPVEIYEYQGRMHFLDNKARALFDQGVKNNFGVYTTETYRTIMQYVREQQQKRISDQRAKNDNGKLNSFVLGRYYRRSEERMNFVTDVVVKATIDGRPAKFKAVTVDISLQGMQLKLPGTIPVRKLKQQLVSVYHTGLAAEFVFNGTRAYEYQVLGTHSKDRHNYLRLRRRALTEPDALDTLLQGLLNGYKYRYKVNVDHVIHSVRAKGHETQWLQAQQGIPLVFNGAPDKTVYAIKTASNSDLLEQICRQQPLLFNGLINERWIRLKLAKLRGQSEQTRLQIPFYFMQLPVNGQQRQFAIPGSAIRQQPVIKNILAGLSRAGYQIQSLVLSITYNHVEKLFVGLLSELELPAWQTVKSVEFKLAPLRHFQVFTQGVKATKVVSEHQRLIQLYTQCGLCNALFVYQDQFQHRDIGLAALMPFKEGLPGWFQNPGLWLSKSHKILGGKKFERELLQHLNKLKPCDSARTKTLLLRLSKSDGHDEPSVTGRWLSDFVSFNEASLYMQKLYQQKKLLAVNIELYRCRRPKIQALRDDLNYVQSYLPHRAKTLEQQIKSIDAVIGVQDVTAPLLRLAMTS